MKNQHQGSDQQDDDIPGKSKSVFLASPTQSFLKRLSNHVFSAFIQRMGYPNRFLSPIKQLYTALHTNKSMRISSTY
jgi:hypothetical protein